MQPALPVLTPERIDAMLSRTAEVCMEAIEEAGVRLKAAADEEAFERCGRTLQTSCRNLRQTIAMKQRFDREQLKIAAERLRDAEDRRRDAQRAGRADTGRRRWRVRSHFARVLWDEFEADDAQEIFNDLDARLGELARDDDFLDTPVETLIERLAEEFGVTAPAEAAHAAAPPPA